jgi:D-glycero-alpha-D-manno-heptose-7-phosphate kinase
MIIVRTPFRISFVGGGTDIRSYYKDSPGKVLSTSIDKYIYVVVKRQIGIVEYKYRVNWSKVEFKNSIDDIEHPIVREALKMMGIDFPLEISTFADVPANTGLGSSSAFAVGLLHALSALRNESINKYTLASKAAEIEVSRLSRAMGKQDHFASAFGGFNIFTFFEDEGVGVEPLYLDPRTQRAFQQNLLLFYTGLKRDASEVLSSQIRETDKKRTVLKNMCGLVDPLAHKLSLGDDLDEIGHILNENWNLKKSISVEISSSEIDTYYEKALRAGAVGGKLLGAGGGGFLLLYVRPENQDRVKEAMSGLYHLDFCFDHVGSSITFFDQLI